MPFKELMNWDDDKRRWHRMCNGTMYRVTPRELGCSTRSRDESRGAANEWWTKKEAEIESPPQITNEIRAIESRVPLTRTAVDVLLDLVARGPAKAPERKVQRNAESFLAVVRGDMQPLSFRELRQYIVKLVKALGAERDVNLLDEAQVEKMYLELRNSNLSAGVKKKRWGFFRRFVRYLWGKRLIDQPRNLTSYNFEVRPQKIKTYTPSEVQAVLAGLKPRLRLYAYLGLNTGMTSADMGQLRKDQVNLDEGRLVRKRVKTADNPNVPEVDYLLWLETLELLKEHRSTDPELFLTSQDGTPLWRSDYEGDKTPTCDLIYQQFRRANAPVTVKSFRSISATALEAHPIYGRFTTYFLGHSPKSIKDRHYAAPSTQLFHEALTWLHDELLAPAVKADEEMR